MARSFTIPDLKDDRGRVPHGARVRATRTDTHVFVEEALVDEYGNATFSALPVDVDVSFHATWGGTTTGLKERWFYSHINAVAEGGTGASDAATAKTNLGIGTGDSPQFTAINLGHATDTTITRVSAALIAVEGDNLIRASDVDDTPVNGQTAVPASSNWAFDHTAAADPHTGYVKESEFTQNSGILVGTGSGALAEETGATLRTSIGTYSTAETDSAIDTDVATHAAIKSANATLGHVIVETASKVDVDGNGKLTLGSDVLLEADLEGSPTENESAKAPTSEWAFDHSAANLNSTVHPSKGMCKVYPSTAHVTVAGRNCTVQHDTVVVDADSCWQVGDWYGVEGTYIQADADSDADNLEDDDANFPDAILGSLVKTASNAAGTLNTGVYYVSQTRIEADSLEIHKLSGVNFGASYYYWIEKKHYVTPVTGYYPCFFQMQYSAGVEADERYGIYIYVNGVYAIAALYHSSVAEMVRLPHNGVLALTAGDIVSMHTFTDAAGNPTVGSGIGNTVMTIYCLQET